MVLFWPTTRAIAHLFLCVHSFAIDFIACLLACLADRQLHPALLFLDADGLIVGRAISSLVLIFIYASTCCVQCLHFSDNF